MTPDDQELMNRQVRALEGIASSLDRIVRENNSKKDRTKSRRHKLRRPGKSRKRGST